MATFQTGAGYQFAIDVDQLADTPTGTPDYQNLCPTSVSKALNEAVDTFFRLCDEGHSQNWLTGIDTQFDVTVKGDKDDTTLIALLDAEFSFEKRNRAAIQVTDNFRTSNNVLTADATITAYSDTREVETVIEFTFTFKLRGKPTIS